MDPKFVVSYERGDCSGGVLYVRSGSNSTSEDYRKCSDATAITKTAIGPTSYLPDELYMDLTWGDDDITERIIQHTCVWTGFEHGFAFVDCAEKSYEFFEDGDCKVPLGASLSPTSVSCVLPNGFTESSASKSKFPPKFLKKYENADCTGALLFYDDFTGPMAAAQEEKPCEYGFELNSQPPRPDQFSPGLKYMSVANPYLLFTGTVLDQSCVSYAPGQYVKVDCSTRTSNFYSDDDCSMKDQSVIFPSKVWGVHCSVLNKESTGPWHGFNGILVGLVLLTLAAAGVVGVLWRRNRSSHIQLPLKNGKQPSYHTDGRLVVT